MKKRIFAFVAVLVITFGVLFALPPKKAHAAIDTNLSDITYTLSFDFPFYYSRSLTYFYFYPRTVSVTVKERELSVNLFAKSLGTFTYSNRYVCTYTGSPMDTFTSTPVFYLGCNYNLSGAVVDGPQYQASYSYTAGSETFYDDFLLDVKSVYLTYDTTGNFYIDFLMIDEVSYARLNFFITSSTSEYSPNLITSYKIITYDFSALFNDFYDFGYLDGGGRSYAEGFEKGDAVGYNRGFAAARDIYQQIGDISFFSLISSAVDVPVKAFTNLFNFEILGINLFDFMTGLLTLALVITIFRIIFR